MWALLLVLGGLGVGLVLAEGAARVVEHFWCLTQYQGAARRSRTFGWGHQPGARGWFQSCPGGALEWRTYSRFDQGGLRSDRDVPRARSDAVRVLVIGDSFTEGLQVPLDQTWVHLAERRLNETAPPGVRYELLNAGMSAWGTDNELLWYLHEGRYYRPDVVLLAFNTSNDVFENDRALVSTNFGWPDKPYFALEQNRLVLRGYPLEPEPRRRVVVRAAICWLVLRSALMRRLADIDYFKNRLILPGPPGGPTTNVAQPVEGYLRDPPPHWSEAWRITRGLVLRLRSEVEARGSRFVVVVLNGKAEVAPAMWPWLARHGPYKDAPVDLDRPNRLITKFLARRDIPTVATLDAFRERFGARGHPGFFGFDVHYAPPGHALAADVVADGLRRANVLPNRPRGDVRD